MWVFVMMSMGGCCTKGMTMGRRGLHHRKPCYKVNLPNGTFWDRYVDKHNPKP